MCIFCYILYKLIYFYMEIGGFNKKVIGYTGENIVCGYLVDKKYKIIDKNYRTKFGELDIILKSSDKTLVFCEVKTMKYKENIENMDKNIWKGYPQKSGNNVDKLGKVWQSLARNEHSIKNDYLKPEDQITDFKIKKFKRISEWYANNNLEKLGCKDYRLDLIMVDLYDDKAKVRWYKNIS